MGDGEAKQQVETKHTSRERVSGNTFGAVSPLSKQIINKHIIGRDSSEGRGWGLSHTASLDNRVYLHFAPSRNKTSVKVVLDETLSGHYLN